MSVPVLGPTLKGHRAAVLGATSGIGRATALLLADAGADVVVHGRSRPAAAREVAAECRRRSGGRAEVVLADLADPVAATQVVDDAWAVFGGLDSWLQIAGADTLTGANARLPFDAKLRLLLEVDVVAAMTCCRAVGQKMKAQGHGAILTMGWDQAETGMEGDSGELFAATKGAVMAFTRSLALSLAPTVRVNGVAPGWIKTAWGDGASTAWQERVLRETPLHRWGLPEDVAAAYRFLAGPDAGYLTGQILRVNGGAIRV